MRPGRETDCAISQQVFGYRVYVKKHVLFEETPKGERPLSRYTKEMEAAWDVAEKMKISIIPVETNNWFALVGAPQDGWKSPAEFITYIQTGEFAQAGAALEQTAPLAICTAALRSIEGRRAAQALKDDSPLNNIEPPSNVH